MKKQIKLKILSILFIAGIFILSSCKSEQTQTPNDVSSTTSIFELKLIDNEVCLLSDKKTVKKYEINPRVLPSEDILLLTEGIIVKDENEADSVAENFDG